MAINSKSIKRHFLNFFEFLIKPRSKNSDDSRKERILNILLVCSIVFGVVAFISSTISYSTAIRTNRNYSGVPGYSVLAAIAFLTVLYFLSRKGKYKFVSYVFVFSFLLLASFTTFMWGANVPQAILTNALVIVMSGILVNTRFAFLNLLLITISSLFLLHFIATKDIIYNQSWAANPPEIADILINTLTFFAIAVISWLYNRELKMALDKVTASEKELQKERDSLEIRVEERTQDLNKVHTEKTMQLYRFADFGRLAAGLFHDLVSPLNVVSLNIESLKSKTSTLREDQEEIKKIIKRACHSIKIVEEYVRSIRNQNKGNDIISVFSLNSEIKSTIENLCNKASSHQVKINFISKDKIFLHGNHVRFHQVVSNLISNAIDSYKNSPKISNRIIIITLQKKNKNAVLEVKDFGCGMNNEILSKIFEPFFTTKEIDEGTGIGLTVCKDIVREKFNGKISVKSHPGKGSVFTVTLPYH